MSHIETYTRKGTRAMNEVDAVKTDSQRQQVEHLLSEADPLYFDIWKIGVNVALRISDLLSITMTQARSIDPDTLELKVVESKTGKTRLLTFNPPAMNIINRRIADNPDHVHLFQSVSPKNSRREEPKPINRRSVTRVFERVGQSVTPKVQLGTHSMRKTRGYVMHKAGMRIEEISKALGHSHTAVTMAYIGLDAEAVRRSFLEFEL